MAEAEGAREGGLDAPIEGRVGALQTLAPVLAGSCRTLVIVHLALIAAVAWGTHMWASGHTGSQGSTLPLPPGKPWTRLGQQFRIWSRIF